MRQISRWLLLGLGILLLACRQTTNEFPFPSPLPAITHLTLAAPKSAPVNTLVQITISADIETETTGQLLLQGGYGVHLYDFILRNGTSLVDIPAVDTQIAGRVDIFANVGSSRVKGAIDFLPEIAADPLVPLVGARSIIADGEHWAMVSAIPADQFGNPVEAGSAVKTRIQHPDFLEEETVFTEHLIIWKRIWSGTKAGRTVVIVHTDSAFGAEKDLWEIAGFPKPFSLESISDRPMQADGRQLLILKTSTIVDKFANPIPDGTLFNFYVEDEAGLVRQLPAFILDGFAKTTLQAPEKAGTLTIYGTLFGVESEPMQVTFASGPAIGTFPVHVELDHPNGDVVFVAGPVLGQLSQFVPDGTTMKLTLTLDDEIVATKLGIVDLGYTTLRLRLFDLAAGNYHVLIEVGEGKGEENFVIP